eukprot:5976738-Amphidinium_carterae.1
MAVPNLSTHITMSSNTDSSTGKAVASQVGLNKKTKHVQSCDLYIQDIVQRGQLTITKIPTTHNPAVRTTVTVAAFLSNTSNANTTVQKETKNCYSKNSRQACTATATACDKRKYYSVDLGA